MLGSSRGSEQNGATGGPTSAGAIVYVALFGAGPGWLMVMRAALLAERYGSTHYGSINGALS